MPEILNKNIDDNSKFVVWNASESLSFFKDKVNLSDIDKLSVAKFKTDKRKIEFYCVRYILKNLLSCNKQIKYDVNRKPIIDKKNNISISHSNNYIAVYLSNNTVGIDIEKISEKSLRVRDKFLNNNEIQLIGEQDINFYYTLFWSAKETIFKLYSEKHLPFKDVIFIKEIGGDYLNVTITQDNFIDKQKVYFKKIANFVITWV